MSTSHQAPRSRLATLTILVLAICSINVHATDGDDPARPRPRVVLLGIDGLSENVISRLLECERLPAIQRLRQLGTWGTIASIEPTLSPALWTTIATGKTRDKHGITGFSALDADGRRIVMTRAHRRTRALWNILSDTGFTVGTIGYFTTWPVDEVQGFMISDASVLPIVRGFFPQTAGDTMASILTPLFSCGPDSPCSRAQLSDLGGRILRGQIAHYSPAMFAYLDRLGGALVEGYPELKRIRCRESHDACNPVFFSPDRLESEIFLRAALVDNLRFEYAKALYTDELDFFALYLKGPDIVSHHAWQYYEPDTAASVGGAGPAQVSQRFYADLIPKYYEHVDQMIGYFLGRIDSETTLIVVSDHGFKQHEQILEFDINRMLHAMGYLEYQADGSIVKGLVFDTKPDWWRDALFRHLHFSGSVPGRSIEPAVIVEALSTVKVAGIPLFSRIESFPKKRPGQHTIQCDISRSFETEFPAAHPDLAGLEIEIRGKVYPLVPFLTYRTGAGDHSTYEGVFHIIGPDCKQGYRVKGVSILDITPIVLQVLGLPIAVDMDGSLPIGIFRDGYLVENQPRYIGSYETSQLTGEAETPVASPADQDLQEQLRALGYLTSEDEG